MFHVASLVCKMSPQPCTHPNWRQSIVPIHRRCIISSRCKVDLPPGKQNSSFLTLPWPPPRTQPPWVRSKLPRIQKSPPTVCRPMCVPVLSVFGSYLGKPTLSGSRLLDFVGCVHGVRAGGPSTVASDVGPRMCPGMLSMHRRAVCPDGPGRVAGGSGCAGTSGCVNVWTCVVICYTANIRVVPFYASHTHSVVGDRRDGMTTNK